MFSMGNAEPRPYSNTLERAGMSWVVVTNTFTQFGLRGGGKDRNVHTVVQSWHLNTHTTHKYS